MGGLASSKWTSPTLPSPHPGHGHFLPLCPCVSQSFQNHKGGWNVEAKCQEVTRLSLIHI